MASTEGKRERPEDNSASEEAKKLKTPASDASAEVQATLPDAPENVDSEQIEDESSESEIEEYEEESGELDSDFEEGDDDLSLDEKLAVAKQMKDGGEDITLIMEYTHLPQELIESL